MENSQSELDSQDPVAHQQQAELHLTRDSYPQAVDEALWATKLSPASAKGWKTLGCAQMGMKHYKAALSAFRKAAEIDPADGSLASLMEVAEQRLLKAQQQKYSDLTS